jgi:hypothetical protein
VNVTEPITAADAYLKAFNLTIGQEVAIDFDGDPESGNFVVGSLHGLVCAGDKLVAVIITSMCSHGVTHLTVNFDKVCMISPFDENHTHDETESSED